MFKDKVEVSVDVSTHSRLKAAGDVFKRLTSFIPVSTHSRLKAAGFTFPVCFI